MISSLLVNDNFCIGVFLISLTYLLSKLFRSANNKKSQVSITILTISMMIYGVLYLSHVYINLDSLNPGSDSKYFYDLILKSSDYYNFDNRDLIVLDNDSKVMHLILYKGILLTSNILGANFYLIAYIFNIIMYCATILNFYKLKKSRSFNLLILANLIAPLVVFSLLRETFIVFIISEILIILSFKRLNYLRLITLNYLLLKLRAFLVFPSILLVLRRNKRLFIFTIILLSLIVIKYNSDLAINIIKSSLYSADTLGIDEVNFILSNEAILNLNVFQTVLLFFQRLIIGMPKFLITPLITSQILDFNILSSDGVYNGFYHSILYLGYSCFFTFIIFPKVTYSIFQNRVSKGTSVSYNFSLVMITLLSFAYGVKFLGAHHFKIDFILFPLFILISEETNQPVPKKWYFFSVGLMLLTNLVYMLK